HTAALKKANTHHVLLCLNRNRVSPLVLVCFMCRGATLRGAQKTAPSKKTKKQELCFCFAGQSFFCAPFYSSNQYFDIKKKSNIRVKLAKNRKRKGYVRPCCCQNMQAQ